MAELSEKETAFLATYCQKKWHYFWEIRYYLYLVKKLTK